MSYDPQRHKRHSLRLHNYQYDTAGGYSVTICTHQKQMLFGQISNGTMEKSNVGEIVEAEWLKLTVRYPSILLDQFVIMPNHFHGIIFLTPGEQALNQPLPVLGTIIGAFKSLSARAVGTYLGQSSCCIWQRNYYEQIIRSELMLDAFRRYIDDNPCHWTDDAENNLPLL